MTFLNLYRLVMVYLRFALLICSQSSSTEARHSDGKKSFRSNAVLSKAVVLAPLATVDPGYQTSSPWSHFRGLSNYNTVLSELSGPIDLPVLTWNNQVASFTTSTYSTPVIAADGSVYIGLDTSFYAFSAQGTIKWSYAITFKGGNYDFQTFTSAAIGSSGNIYFGVQEHFYSLSPSGVLNWSYKNSKTFYASPAIGNDGSSIYIPSKDKLYSFYAPSGSIKWEADISNSYFSSPAVNDDTIYIGSLDYNLYAISTSGTVVWKYATSNEIISTPIINPNGDGTIYIGSMDYYLYALSSLGTLIWKKLLGSPLYIISPAVSSDGNSLYLPYDSTQYIAISSDTGDGKWSYIKSLLFINSSAAIGADGTIYVNSYYNSIYAFSTKGILLWEYKSTDYNINYYASSVVIASNGVIYSASTNGHVYALTGNYNPPSTSPSSNKSNNNTSISVGAIVGIIVGFAVLACLISVLFYLNYKKKLRRAAVYKKCNRSNSNLSGKSNGNGSNSNRNSRGMPYTTATLNGNNSNNDYQNNRANNEEYKSSSNSSSNNVPVAVPVPFYTNANHNASNTTLNSKKGDYLNSIMALHSNTTSGGCVPLIQWKDLKLYSSRKNNSRKNNIDKSKYGDNKYNEDNKNDDEEEEEEEEDHRDAIIGKGSFGLVFRATLLITQQQPSSDSNTDTLPLSATSVDVVVKAMKQTNYSKNDKVIYDLAYYECRVMLEAESRMVYKDCIVKVYGIAHGSLPRDIADILNAQTAIGIVMRYEGGGTLTERIHPTIQSLSSKKLVSAKKLHNSCKSLQSTVHTFNCDTMNDENNTTNSKPLTKLTNTDTTTLQSNTTNNSDSVINNLINNNSIDIVEKLRLITSLAHSISELHAAGIVHGDIKPDNILLSSDDPPEVRLADFGLARIKEDYNIMTGMTSLNETKHTKGTLLYCAPEMMVNPYENDSNNNSNNSSNANNNNNNNNNNNAMSPSVINHSMVAKASQKSDMYAFAIVSWEILTGLKPFQDVKYETALSMKVHQGERPSLNKIPSSCPKKVIDMIDSCWDRNRFKRLSATKCFIRLLYEYRQLTNVFADVCLSYHKSNAMICEYYYHRLTQLGCKVTMLEPEDNNDNSNSNSNNDVNSFQNDNNSSMSNSNNTTSGSIKNLTRANTTNNSTIYECNYNSSFYHYSNKIEENLDILSHSQVMVVFLSVAYQEDKECLNYLRKARQMQPPRVILPVFLEAEYHSWTDQDVDYLCQVRSEKQKIWDISTVIATNNNDSNNNNTADENVVDPNLRANAYIDDDGDSAKNNQEYNVYIDDLHSFIAQTLTNNSSSDDYLEKFFLSKQTSPISANNALVSSRFSMNNNRNSYSNSNPNNSGGSNRSSFMSGGNGSFDVTSQRDSQINRLLYTHNNNNNNNNNNNSNNNYQQQLEHHQGNNNHAPEKRRRSMDLSMVPESSTDQFDDSSPHSHTESHNTHSNIQQSHSYDSSHIQSANSSSYSHSNIQHSHSYDSSHLQSESQLQHSHSEDSSPYSHSNLQQSHSYDSSHVQSESQLQQSYSTDSLVDRETSTSAIVNTNTRASADTNISASVKSPPKPVKPTRKPSIPSVQPDPISSVELSSLTTPSEPSAEMVTEMLPTPTIIAEPAVTARSKGWFY